jgi:hypothetical protein
MEEEESEENCNKDRELSAKIRGMQKILDLKI